MKTHELYFGRTMHRESLHLYTTCVLLCQYTDTEVVPGSGSDRSSSPRDRVVMTWSRLGYSSSIMSVSWKEGTEEEERKKSQTEKKDRQRRWLFPSIDSYRERKAYIGTNVHSIFFPPYAMQCGRIQHRNCSETPFSVSWENRLAESLWHLTHICYSWMIIYVSHMFFLRLPRSSKQKW